MSPIAPIQMSLNNRITATAKKIMPFLFLVTYSMASNNYGKYSAEDI